MMTQNLLQVSCEFEHPNIPLVVDQPIKGLFRVRPNRDLKYASIRYYVLLRLVSASSGAIEEERIVYHKKFPTKGVGEWDKVPTDKISPYEYPFQFTLQEMVSYHTRDFSLQWYIKFDADFLSISGKALEKALNRGLDFQSPDFPKSSIEQEFPFTLERGNKYLSAINQQVNFKIAKMSWMYWSFAGLGGLGLLYTRFTNISSILFDCIGTLGLGLGFYHMLKGSGNIGEIRVNLTQDSADYRLTNINVTVRKGWSKIKKIGAYFKVLEQVRSKDDLDTITGSFIRYYPDVEIQKDVTRKETTLQIKLTPNTLPPSMSWGSHLVIWRMYLSVYLSNNTKKIFSFDFEVKL